MQRRLGILGGGQLGMYLCQAARRLGIETHILTEEEGTSATFSADVTHIGELDEELALEHFLGSCDVVTFEKEDIPDDVLLRLQQAQARDDLQCFPDPRTLALLKDKGQQKDWLVEHDFPTLPYLLIEGTGDGNASPADLISQFGPDVVQKARRGGYDGMGVQLLRDEAARDDLWDTPSVIEPLVPDCREISVLVVRGQDGTLCHYQPVGMEFDPRLNAVDLCVMPAEISDSLAEQAVRLGRDIVAALEGVGVFAIEMFITQDDELLVNEISPRVHNSGHLTMEACETSQFEQHVRAVTGLPLQQSLDSGASAMINILYSEPLRPACPNTPITAPAEGDDAVTLHWYGKPPGRHGRKMGHITALANNPVEAAALARQTLASLTKKENNEAA